MNDVFTSVQVEYPKQKPRVFRFDESEVRIGFNPKCHLVLEPIRDDGAIVVIKSKPGEISQVLATSGPGVFSLNDAPLRTEATLKNGDTLSADSCRIVVLSLLGISGQKDSREEDDLPTVIAPPREDPVPKANTSSSRPATVPQNAEPRLHEDEPAPQNESVAKNQEPGLDYLYLFFKPVEAYLRDDAVSEIMINGPNQIYVERKGRLTPTPAKFLSEQALQAAVMNVARSVGRFFNVDNPRLDARLPDGSRVHAVMPPMSRKGTIVAIRKFSREKLTIDRLVEFGSISPEGAQLLRLIVTLGKNLIVSGATSSGKTSVLNVLSAIIPDTDRILVLEDSSELQLQQPHVIPFETRKEDENGKGEVSIRDLLHSALRLRPDRLVVGEIRGGEALDLLQAMNTGHEGSMSTIHANSPRDSLFRLETCSLFSGVEMPLAAIREQVASAIQIVIQTARLHDGTRKITNIAEVMELQDHNYVVKDILIFQEDGLTPDGKIAGRHVLTGHEPKFISQARKRGLDLEGLSFKE